MAMKKLPLGIENFEEIRTEDFYYIDKSMLIADLLNGWGKVNLFTRPRRFGKTLNMSMLKSFFEIGTNPQLFDGLAISKETKLCEAYMGKFPVLFISLKGVEGLTYQDAERGLANIIIKEAKRFRFLKDSTILSEDEKEDCKDLINGSFEKYGLQQALLTLTNLLCSYYGRKVILLIDEYDVPLDKAFQNGYYREMLDLVRSMFHAALKTNDSLYFAVMTGCLRVSKESIFTGLNNLKVHSISDEQFDEYFGFTHGEVETLLKEYGIESHQAEFKEWYDGYRFGNTEIFNPWSVINYISDNCFPKAFWQSTGSNEIIGEIIQTATPEITKDLYKLLCGEKIAAYIDTGVIYPEVQNNPYSIYSFLLVAGYLKVANIYPQSDGNFMCDVAIPNKEITFVYEKEVLNRTNQNSLAISISQAIFSKDTQKLQSLLEDFMVKSISSIDGANEGFYHGMMLGLCAILGNRYKIRSNRESGLGRFDIQLMPLAKGMPGFIFEFKHTKDEHTDLSALADSALQQIETKKYDTELRDNGVNSIISIGIAFRGKSAVVRRG